MGDTDETIPAAPTRTGSGADLARRIERMEQRHDELAKDVTSLGAVVARVEQNQVHLIELNSLRFTATDAGLKSVQADVKLVSTQLSEFMKRIEGMISGEIRTSQTDEFIQWRKDVDNDREAAQKFQTQGQLIGRITIVLLGTGWVGTALSILYILANKQ